MPTIREVPRLCELVFFLDGVLAEPLPSPLCIPSLWWAQEGFGGVSRQMCYGHRGVVLPMKGASPGGPRLEPRSRTQVTLRACLFGRHSPRLCSVSACAGRRCRQSCSERAHGPGVSPGNAAVLRLEHDQHRAGHAASEDAFWGRRHLMIPWGEMMS